MKTKLFMVLALLPGFALPGAAQEKVESAKKQAEKTGLKVGEKAPAFTLKDQADTERTLDEFTKVGKVALVFYRSASW